MDTMAAYQAAIGRVRDVTRRMLEHCDGLTPLATMCEEREALLREFREADAAADAAWRAHIEAGRVPMPRGVA